MPCFIATPRNLLLDYRAISNQITKNDVMLLKLIALVTAGAISGLYFGVLTGVRVRLSTFRLYANRKKAGENEALR